ncbi:MAG: 4-(cytidine 5'-diphospho)-2-C-methyl-D-erythritol kinase [Saccharofermentanales bacterium]
MIRKCIVKAPAKINLSLDVIGKRPDGYHLLESIMQTVDLYDTIMIEVSGEVQTDILPEIIVHCSDNEIPTDTRNTAYRAALAYFRRLPPAGTGSGKPISKVEISIRKGIPREAGLAGGSADAAGTLAGLNHIFEDALTWGDLQSIAAATGADVPFCLTGGTALCRGIGEILEPAADFSNKPVLLVKPDFGISTPWAFRQLDAVGRPAGPDTPAILDALSKNDVAGVFSKTANVLEFVAAAAHPAIGEIKERLQEMRGCRGSLMSGSGAAVYAVFANPANAQDAAERMRVIYGKKDYWIETARTVGTGPEITDG